MIIDNLLKFTEAGDLSSILASSNDYIGSELDLGIGVNALTGSSGDTPNIGEAGWLMWNVICENTDFASVGSPVVTIDLHAAAATGMASPDTIATLITDKTPNDGDVIGRVPVPMGTFKQFAMVNVATTSALTAGAITSWLGGISETPK